MLQEEDLTLFNGAQSQARQDVDTLNNHDDKLDFASCSSCGAAVACDAFAVEEESLESDGGQQAVLRVFRVCGLTRDQDRASLNRVGECIYSFFCYLQGGSQHLEEACMRSASSLKLLCANCYTSRETQVSFQYACSRVQDLDDKSLASATKCKQDSLDPEKTDSFKENNTMSTE
jgi:hypothetical protein